MNEPRPFTRPYEDHPAYGALVDGFRGSTASPEHLAFVALAALESGGFKVEKNEPAPFWEMAVIVAIMIVFVVGSGILMGNGL